ncbi:MAG: putative amidohydrolase/ribosomal protein S18 acetylase RimI-like enzyme [Planctomycetota bacterium]|jgi:predicted amidohydrolase/ribosomal protein S18 acetylase RimI-like enzyme
MTTPPTASPETPDSGGAADPLQLADFEKKIVLRPLAIEDFDALVAMQAACFPGMETWSREHIESQLKMFPEGQMVIIYQGEIVASAGSLIVDSDLVADWHDWRIVADSGYIRTHAENGDTLYGIEIMVHPRFRGLRLARRLYEARKELVRQHDLARIIIGGRIPGYGAKADEMTAREYVEQVTERGLYDPVLTTQVANGFVLRKLIPNYFPSDHASRGYATHLEWTNLEYVDDPNRRWAHVAPARIAAVQYLMRHLDTWEEFCQQCEYFIDAAADAKSDFVLFPELMTTQLLALQAVKRPAGAVRELAEWTPQYLAFFTRMSIKYNVNIIGGSQFTLTDERLQNVAYLFRRDGTIERQAKLHPTPAEVRWWGVEGGDAIHVFDTDRGRVAILVCYDIQFPEVARIAVGMGARILFVPFNTDNREGYLRVRYCAQARAIENDVYVAISGCAGNLPFVDNADTHYAQSGIFTPLDYAFARDGIAGECTPNIETLVVHDVDLEALRRHRHQGTVKVWADRRTDLYSVVHRRPGEDDVIV